jgi:hypothetical protein
MYLHEKYKAVIKKGRDTFEKVINVSYKNNAGLSSEDRKFQFETVMKLFNMTEDLAYTVYTIDEIISSEEMSKKTKSKFDELKKKLVITTGDNYVGAAKKQLREKMADLYSKVASSYDIPSENELDNLKLIEKEMVSAKNSYNKLLKKVDLSKLNLKTYDEFVNE